MRHPRTLVSSMGVVVASSGCATALSRFQPAHVPEKGHVQAEVGMDVSIASSTVTEAIDAADALDAVADNRALTDPETRELIEGAANLTINGPTAVPHIGVAYAPWEHWELGLRFAASGWRLGARRQLLEQKDHGVDLSVGAGVGRAAVEPPVGSVLDTIEIEDFVRWNIDLPITVGAHGDAYRWWAGPQLVYSHVSQAMNVSLPFQGTGFSASLSGDLWYVGGYAGAAFGYKWIFIGPELTLAYVFGSADIDVFGTRASADLDSFIVYPGIALMGEF